MHMTKTNSETPIQYSFWSACIALVTVFAIADAITGGLLRESIVRNSAEYAVAAAFMIATVGAYAKDAPPGQILVRACSFNKL
ncbi:MAG: hypothetical protein H7336_04315 [Bacteriovorax sp.]|nr:hypothetical protein [Bacteriovorax sp.]